MFTPVLGVNVCLAQQIGCVFVSKPGLSERISTACSGSTLELDVEACKYTSLFLLIPDCRFPVKTDRAPG